MSGLSGPKSAPRSLDAVSGGQQEAVNNYRATQEGFQRRFAPPVNTNPELLETQLTAALAQKGGLPQTVFHTGHFIPHDPEDTKMKTLSGIVNSQTGATPFGMVSADPNQLVSYVQGKADKQARMDELRTAEYLIDPKDPRTIKKLYELFPELEKVPEAWYTDYQTLQWTLRDLLQYGEINSREHHNLVMYICSPGFKIPTYPAWDPMGAIIETTANQKTWREYLQQGNKVSRFNPFQYASEGVGADKFEIEFQKQIKGAIIRRLYPACREMNNDEIEQHVIKKIQSESGAYSAVPNTFSPALLMTNDRGLDVSGGLGAMSLGKAVGKKV
jgi:hypothetical protein